MSLITLTDKPGEYSAGVSEMSFTTPWNLNPFPSRYETQGASVCCPGLDRTGLFRVSMETQGVTPPGFGSVRFSFSGIQPSQESVDAALMLISCHVMLLRIPAMGLLEAFDRLREISSYYEDWPTELPAPSKTSQVSATAGRSYQRPEFYVEE
jgi:hypothetical protein